jgi:hypothetical protein
MKTFLFGILGMWAIIAVFVGCVATPQRTEYTTIATVEAAASAALDGYFSEVAHQQVPTNGIPAVSKAFGEIQAAGILAASVSQSGTNALSTTALNQDLADFTSLINTLESK